ncbi:MAG TPA: hypothetical protein DCY64_02330 [Hydrogenophaga sp.]|nr:hypothetical protein [Hydrogenophaga sp.]HBU17652.1 hypothetical protein [Hydrogenophaga sp.]
MPPEGAGPALGRPGGWPVTPTLRRCAGRCPPRGLIRLGAARRRIGKAPTLRRCASRCPVQPSNSISP